MSISEPVQIALVATISPTLLGCLGLLHQVIIYRRSEEARLKLHEAIEAHAANVLEIEISTNSMKDALVKATGDAKRSEGVTAGLEQAKNESNAKVALEASLTNPTETVKGTL